ncbi:hypothetical protein CSUI_007536, partial [Cystoisospora suis]
GDVCCGRRTLPFHVAQTCDGAYLGSARRLVGQMYECNSGNGCRMSVTGVCATVSFYAGGHVHALRTRVWMY